MFRSGETSPGTGVFSARPKPSACSAGGMTRPDRGGQGGPPVGGLAKSRRMPPEARFGRAANLAYFARGRRR
jgi:hypothetical protein